MDIINIIAVIITVFSFAFSLYQFNEKKKLENFTLKVLRSIAGNLCKIQQSTEWTFANIRNLQLKAGGLQDDEVKKEIVRLLSDAQGDAAAADRLVVTVFNDVLTFQDATFNTTEISHPEKRELALWKKVEENKYNN